MVLSVILTAKLVPTSSGFQLKFFNGDHEVTDLGSVDVQFTLNGKNIQTVKVENGKASYPYNIDNAMINKITAIIRNEILNLDLDIKNSNNTDNSPNIENNSKSNNGMKNKWYYENNNKNNSKGSGNNNGLDGSNQVDGDNGNKSGKFISPVGTNGLFPKGIVGSLGSEIGKTYEINPKNIIEKIKESSIIPYIIFIILIILVGAGYFKKKKIGK